MSVMGCDATRKFKMAAMATNSSNNHSSGLTLRIGLIFLPLVITMAMAHTL